MSKIKHYYPNSERKICQIKKNIKMNLEKIVLFFILKKTLELRDGYTRD